MSCATFSISANIFAFPTLPSHPTNFHNFSLFAYFLKNRYLTDDFWHYSPFWDGWKSHHHSHMAEFCCEFTAELVSPSCPNNGGFPNAPIEKMICDIFDEEDLRKKATLKRQARDACYCYYRSLGCDNSLLEDGGYCNYPTNEIVLDDFRFANSSLVNMCNNCLEYDNNNKDYPYRYPRHYEGHSFNQCLGYCFLKKGDPNHVFKPTVENHQCCLDTHGHGFGLELHGYEDNEKANKEISFFPAVGDPHQKKYDYFFSQLALAQPTFPTWSPAGTFNRSPPETFNVMISYDGVDTATMEVERHGDESAVHMVDEFIVDCGAGKWDSINIHVYDESPDGGIALTNVELDNVLLGDFGFAVKDESCPTYSIKPDIAGVHGHNHTCITRPGGYGHVAGFELTGKIELNGRFEGDDIGLALTVGCSQPKEVREVGCCGSAVKEVPTVWSGGKGGRVSRR